MKICPPCNLTPMAVKRQTAFDAARVGDGRSVLARVLMPSYDTSSKHAAFRFRVGIGRRMGLCRAPAGPMAGRKQSSRSTGNTTSAGPAPSGFEFRISSFLRVLRVFAFRSRLSGRGRACIFMVARCGSTSMQSMQHANATG